jgi:hypothetical protein
MKMEDIDTTALNSLDENLRREILAALEAQVIRPTPLAAEPIQECERVVCEMSILEVACCNVLTDVIDAHNRFVDSFGFHQCSNECRFLAKKEVALQDFIRDLVAARVPELYGLYGINTAIREGNKIVRLPLNPPGTLVFSFGLPLRVMVIDRNGLAQFVT